MEELAALGAEGFVIENEDDFKDFLDNNQQYWDYVDSELEAAYSGVSRIKLYLMDDADGEAILAAILAAFPDARHGYTADQDWENSWRDYYEPIDIGEKLLVVPEWIEVTAGERLPLRPYAKEGVKVLVLGCGSGILGIGALILGADKAVGCDIDPMASDAAMSNAALNGIGADRLNIHIGDIIKDGSLRRRLGSGYELVLANIVADVIIALSPIARSFMADNGIFICSGIIDDRCVEVRQKLCDNGFEIISHTQEEEWHCFVCR